MTPKCNWKKIKTSMYILYKKKTMIEKNSDFIAKNINLLDIKNEQKNVNEILKNPENLLPPRDYQSWYLGQIIFKPTPMSL